MSSREYEGSDQMIKSEDLFLCLSTGLWGNGLVSEKSR